MFDWHVCLVVVICSVFYVLIDLLCMPGSRCVCLACVLVPVSVCVSFYHLEQHSKPITGRSVRKCFPSFFARILSTCKKPYSSCSWQSMNGCDWKKAAPISHCV